jgi:hypothetical protein
MFDAMAMRSTGGRQEMPTGDVAERLHPYRL